MPRLPGPEAQARRTGAGARGSLAAVRSGVGFGLAAWGAPSSALAAGGGGAAAASGIGPWLFGCLAVLVVAVASYLAGRWQPRRPDARAPDAGRPDPAPPAAPPDDAAATPQPATAPVPAETAEPLRHGATPAAARAPALERLAAALAHDARPVLLLQGRIDDGSMRLAAANASALRQLGGRAELVGRPWSEVAVGAPAALRKALSSQDVASSWWLLRDDDPAQCLALGPAGAGIQDDTASLVYTVTHDLRAPIRVVEGFTRIVKEDYGRQLDRVGNDHLDRVLAAGARMNQMIEAVLTMARLSSQPLVRQPVDLSQLASYIGDELRRGSPERVVELRIEAGLRAQGDPTLLRLVLENLLGNAWKYSARVAPARIEFGAESADGRQVYFVRDNGAGFDMRVADRLFGLFQRLHSAKDFAGTGVGLASVRRIVQRHGGDVWAEAEPGHGATFHFTLAD